MADAWRAALRTPNFLQNLLGEGTLSASFIPIYSEMLEQGREEDARRFAGAALGILTATAAGLSLAGWLAAPLLVEILFGAWSDPKQALTVELVRILFPMAGILVVSAWALGILNSHRQFFISYMAPAFWNLAQIGAMLAGAIWLGFEGRDLVVVLAWGAFLGALLQFGVQVPWVLKNLAGRVRPSLGRGVDGVREAIRNFGPVVAARGVVNVSGYVDTILAARLTEGAVAVMGYAQTFYLLPISLFGMSVAASELPEMSRMREESKSVLADRVRAALRRVMFFLIPSSVAYLLLGDVVIAALYQTGRFGGAETLVTWAVLAAYSLGLNASARSRVLSSAYYALRDTKSPARLATLRVVISASVGIALMVPLDRFGFQGLRLGAAGLALGASVGAWVEYLLLRRRLTREIGDHGVDPGVLLRMGGAAVAAGGAGVLVQVWLPDLHPILVAAASLAPFGLVYFGVASLLGVGIPLRSKA